MGHKHWESWMKFACIPVILFSTTIADFTTECQRPCDCRWQSGNKAAICTNSSLKSIPGNLSNDIQILDLSNNNIRELQQEAFKRVSNLKKLFLKECHIEIVHKTSFATLAIMIELDLSKNRIRYLHHDTFKGTEKLRLINLSNNFIDKLEDGLFRNLKFLQKVELSNNRIVRIGTKTFVNLPQLKILRIDGNNLNHMKPETLMALNNLSGLDLHNNPWRCDCNLQTFRDWVLGRNLFTPPTSCAEPALIRDKLWNELDSSNFACRPTILEPQPDTTVKSYEENVTLICKVVGNPPPEVVWRFNGRIIEMRTFGEIRYVVTENTMDLIKWVNLTILYARYSDKGNYTCIAENPGGYDEKTLSLVLTKYGGATILGIDVDTFAILVGCLTAIVVILGAIVALCYFKTQNYDSKRLIKTDIRSSNGEALIESSVASGLENSIKAEVNPVMKPPRKTEQPTLPLAREATEMLELNKNLLENESVLVSDEGSCRQNGLEMSKISQEFLLDRLAQDHQYPPDLLSFPLRGKLSPSALLEKHKSQSPVKSPNYMATINSGYNRIHSASSSQGSGPLISPKGYMTLPRRPRTSWFPDSSQPQIFSTLNGVIPYHDGFNMKIFNNSSNYYSLNKSEIDLGPVLRSGSSFYDGSDDIEPAPSPAPGTPHANIPRNSLSSPNIHNQLLVLQSISGNSGHNRIQNPEQRPSKTYLVENEGLLKNSIRDLRLAYNGNIVSDTLNRSNTASKPPPKPKKRYSSELKDQYLLNTSETATQV